jgi:lauroyl/myristoyl acyltransferase
LLVPQGDWLLDEPRAGYNGYQVEHWRRLYRDAGAEMVHHVGSAPRLQRTLRDGGTVLISMDVPGDRRTEFLGKPVDLDDGTARLAVRTGALVLPMALVPAGRRWELEIHEALDPRDFAGPDELHLALARLHERLILRAPEHLEAPGRLWADATARGWYRR